MLSRLVRSHLLPYRRALAIVVVTSLVQASAGLMLPGINADIIEEGVLAGDNDAIRRLGMVMFAFTLVQLVFSAVAVRFGTRTGAAFGRDVRRDLFHQVTAYSAREVGSFGAPSLITRITNDVQQVSQVVTMGCTMLIQAPLTMVVGIVMATRTEASLSPVLLVAVPVAGVVLGSIISRTVPAFRLMQERIDEVNRVLREQITGIRVVRAFVREPEERVRFAGANRDLTDTSLVAARLMAAMFPTITLLIGLSSVAVLWVGADRIAAGTVGVGALVAYLSYLVQILMAVTMMTFMLSMIPRAAVSAQRIVEVLETETSVTPPTDPVRTMPIPGTVELRDVEFRYPGAELPVLSDISFRVEPGTTLAVIGSTGAGKTSLLNLVPRLVDATAGQVLLGGVDVRDLDPELLWSSVGLVPQKPYLFGGTVRSNLAYGKPDATDAEMWAALEVAQASDFVQTMPDGLDSPIEQGGTNVSGGQRQRLSIARALVAKPDVYLFDDSFSALDMATDARLRTALEPWTRESAVLVVAQRVSSIMGADQILVLEDGRVVGLGRHDELVAGCPTYAEIVRSQLGEVAA